MRNARRYCCAPFAIACILLVNGCLGGVGGPTPGQTRTFDGIEFQWCPAGTFVMGSPTNETGHQSNETQFQVTLSDGFWLGKYEVTQQEWESVMGSNPSATKDTGKPVETVSWSDAQAFVNALNAKKGVGPEYRLPTEAEWEYACRAETTARFYWGDDPNLTMIPSFAWYDGNSGQALQDVGEKQPNEWGLYDMSGNVYEWCQDWFGTYPAGPVTDPQGPGTGSARVYRGGSFYHAAVASRSAARYSASATTKDFRLGFRLLRPAE